MRVITKVAVGKLLGRIKHGVFYPKGDHVYVGSFAVGKEPSEASAETFVKQMRVQNSADFAQQNQASEFKLKNQKKKFRMELLSAL